MGLDMYLTGVKTHRRYPQDECDWSPDTDIRPKMDSFPVSTSKIDVGYWRKHADLHGYIVNTFADGKDECQEIELTAEDCTQIAEALANNKLPHTEGFFFGSQEIRDEYASEGLTHARIFIAMAKWLETVDKDREHFRYAVYQASW